ncbi:DUF2190 family protein [Parasegetibacter sp. NRK P23]|uniref:DUF2190 family protein n=1 Tax=Parasegetibacter sp. NRK P23 TaxID=2942999 RepID=UPI00204342AF|nr:DUF2190 family protein [Parasegetibacter sp. NRK P23]MCM5528961.1 DUF2190 family protein [Parasegetibacter sp. NRK P23]
MNNAVAPGNTVEIVAPSGGLTSGQPLLVGGMVGISHSKYAEGETAVIDLEGAYTVPKAGGAAWATGDKLYWDDTNKVFTKTATSNTLAGYAWAVAASGAASGVIILRQ